jgi:hypothetical protein
MLEVTSISTEPVRPSSPSSASSNPGLTQLRLGQGQRLWLERNGKSVCVKPVRCFPWTAPDQLISLRDDDDNEHHLVQGTTELDAESARALCTAIQSAGFVLEVSGIESIEEDYEVRVWKTQTRHGKRTFQTRLDEWPWPSPDGGHLMRDLAGDLVRLPPLETLDAASRDLLWAYVG